MAAVNFEVLEKKAAVEILILAEAEVSILAAAEILILMVRQIGISLYKEGMAEVNFEVLEKKAVVEILILAAEISILMVMRIFCCSCVGISLCKEGMVLADFLLLCVEIFLLLEDPTALSCRKYFFGQMLLSSPLLAAFPFLASIFLLQSTHFVHFFYSLDRAMKLNYSGLLYHSLLRGRHNFFCFFFTFHQHHQIVHCLSQVKATLT